VIKRVLVSPFKWQRTRWQELFVARPKSQDLPPVLSDSATVSAWISHPGRKVHEDGETLFSWIPKGVIGSGVKAPARNFMASSYTQVTRDEYQR
jgi:hypothetical protein